jgi:hypothetical protein
VSVTVAGLIAAAAVLRLPAPAPPPVAAPRAQPAASVSEAIASLLADAGEPGGAIAFGELHQTHQTKAVRSAIARFTDEILPVVAPHASHLIVETWMTRGQCGESEARVTEDVARTTERPVETENEIVRLLRLAKEAGVAPHILDLSCDEYAALVGQGGKVDYDRLLTMTGSHLERAIRQALALPRGGRRPLVLVYGGALHNDLHPDPVTAKYSFGQAIHALTRGAYREIDLFVPEMIEGSAALRAEGWYRSWRKAGRGDQEIVVRRSSRSAVIVFRKGTKSRSP